VLTHQQQVNDNFKAFNEILPTMLEAKRNQYALIKDCVIIEYFSTFKDADKAGKLLYLDNLFSVQKVTDKIILPYIVRYGILIITVETPMLKDII
jgi:hypothetical protein